MLWGAGSPRLGRARPRRYMSVSEIFDEGVSYVRAIVVGNAGCRAFHVFHQAVEIVARIRNGDNADGGAVPEFRRIEFGD